MPLSIKVNLRVTGHCNQGGRKYMEDMFSVAYQQTSDDKDLEYAFFGIFDGHGGGEAATFAKEHLMDIIVKQKNFWSDKDEDVLRAIRDGYVNTHYAMWRELEKWPRTASGLPSTAGTTASIAFIRKGKIYIGHVGDSGIILGYQEDGDPQWKARPLTKDHKPESIPEMSRIQESGGKVISKSGVPRVVWNRPRIGHKGPVRRSTHIDEIPFLAVARSLGDLWSYNSELDTFVVSPEPDVKVVTVDVKSYRCLIFGTDGLWNMLTPQGAVSIVQAAERHNEKHFIASQQTGSGTDQQMWINPSKSLVDRALEKWSSTRLRADNTSVVTLMLDPPGPSRGEVLMNKKQENISTQKCVTVPISAPSLVYQTVTTENEEFNKTPVIYETEPVVEKEPIIISPQINQPQSPIAASDIIQPDQPDQAAVCENNNAEIVDEIIDNIIIDKNTIDVEIEKIPEVLTNSGESLDETTTSVISENIQDPEISSSDLVNCEIENNNKIIIEDKTNEPVIVASEKPDSPTKNPNEISTNESTIESLSPPSSISSPEKPKTVLDQSTNDCDKFKLPLSKIDTQPNIKSPSESRKRSTTNNFDSTNIDKISTSKTELRSAKRRLSINSTQSQIMPATSSQEQQHQQQQPITSQSTIESRLKNSTKDIPETTATTTTTTTTTTTSTTTKIDESITSKRRYSSTLNEQEEKETSLEEPLTKRRTRSEDQRCPPTDENNPINKDEKNSDKYRLRWPNNPSPLSQKTRKSPPNPSYNNNNNNNKTIKDNNDKIPSPTSSFQRRSLEKKATPVKTIRRPSINGSNKVQLRGNFSLRDWDQSKTSRRSCPERSRHNRSIQIDQQLLSATTTPQRWLRSDTIAATPIKTLRSRNVDIAGHTVPPQIAHQYGIVKQNRIAALSGKIKLAGTNKIKTQSIVSSSSSSLPSPSTSTTSSSSSSSSSPPSSSQIINGKLKTNNVIGSSSSSNASPSIAKRVKSIPYNPSARSLGTRSRLKRLGK